MHNSARRLQNLPVN